MDILWQNTRQVTVIDKLRGLITVPAFSALCGPYNRALNTALISPFGLSGAYNIGDLFINSFTIEAWIKLIASPDYDIKQPIIEIRRINNSDAQIDISILNSKVVVVCAQSGAQELTSDTTIGVEVWTHIAVTYDGIDVKIYINGALQTTILPITAPLDTDSDLRLNIGMSGAAPSFLYSFGLIDEVRLWTVAKTPDELLYSMFASQDGMDATLPYYYGFDETPPNDVGSSFIFYNSGSNNSPVYDYAFIVNDLDVFSEEDHFPHMFGGSFVVAEFTMDLDGPYSIKYPVRKPADTTTCAIIRSIDDDGNVKRYKLWTVGETISLETEIYRGQKIQSDAILEFWNIDGERLAILPTSIVLETSKLDSRTIITDVSRNINTSVYWPRPLTIDNTNITIDSEEITIDATEVDDPTNEFDFGLAEEFPLTGFPLEFSSYQTY